MDRETTSRVLVLAAATAAFIDNIGGESDEIATLRRLAAKISHAAQQAVEKVASGKSMAYLEIIQIVNAEAIQVARGVRVPHGAPTLERRLQQRFIKSINERLNSSPLLDFIKDSRSDGWDKLVHTFEVQFKRSLSRALLLFCLELLSQELLAASLMGSNSQRLVRELHFPPEHQQAAIGILSYFSVILKQKDPENKYSVSIEQGDAIVTLTIKYPDGSKEAFTKLLRDYQLVVAGKISPSEFLPDPIQAHMLTQQLAMAKFHVDQMRQTLSITNASYGMRVKSLEEEVKFLRETVAGQLSASTKLQDSLADAVVKNSLPAMNEAQSALVRTIAAAIDSRDDKQLQSAVTALDVDSPGLLDRLHKFIVSNVASGVLGNSVYDWLKIVWPLLPK